MQAVGLIPSRELVGICKEVQNSLNTIETTLALLALPQPPDAFISEDPIGVSLALDQVGKKDVLVAGWMKTQPVAKDCLKYLAICDFKELGWVGVELLLRHLRNPNAPMERLLMTPKIVDCTGTEISI